MTAFVQTLISFAAVVVLAAFVARHTKLPAGLTPLPVLCGILVALVLAGYCGALAFAAWLIFALAGAALLFMLLTGKRGGFSKLRAPGFVLFCAAGLVLVTLFAVRQPVLQDWDEFSLWGPAAALTREYNVIYSEAPMGWPWLGTQKPGMPTLSYFFCFFGEYAAWRMYAAYDLLMIAVWAAALGALSWRQWKLVAPGALMMFLLPYWTVYLRDIYCNFTYLSSYTDIPMGVLCCGALAWYYSATAGVRSEAQPPVFCERRRLPLWPVWLMLAAVALMKDTGLALACVAAGIIAVDLFFAGGEPDAARPRVWGKKLLFTAGMFGSVGVTFWASSRYLASIGSSQGSVGGASDMSYVTMLREGARMLLGLAPTAAGAPFAEKFAVIRTQMVDMLLPGAAADTAGLGTAGTLVARFMGDATHRITMVGCGLYTILLIWAVLAVTLLLCKDRLRRRSVWLYGVLSTLGFFAYYIFIGFTYVFVFKNTELESYSRYINTYYVLWLGTAVVLLLLAAAGPSRWKNSLVLVSLLCSVAWLGRFSQLVSWQLCVVDYPDTVYSETYDLQKSLSGVKAVLQEGDKVYYVNNEDIGEGWFHTSYELLPNILVYSHGGGSFADVALVDEGNARIYEEMPDAEIAPYEGINVLQAEWAAELVREECSYVYVQRASAHFMTSYRALFADEGAAIEGGGAKLYRVVVTGEPAYEPVTPEDTRLPDELLATGEVRPNYQGMQAEEARVKMKDPTAHVTLVPVETKAVQP